VPFARPLRALGARLELLVTMVESGRRVHSVVMPVGIFGSAAVVFEGVGDVDDLGGRGRIGRRLAELVELVRELLLRALEEVPIDLQRDGRGVVGSRSRGARLLTDKEPHSTRTPTNCCGTSEVRYSCTHLPPAISHPIGSGIRTRNDPRPEPRVAAAIRLPLVTAIRGDLAPDCYESPERVIPGTS
jgi:hypothetical protein